MPNKMEALFTLQIIRFTRAFENTDVDPKTAPESTWQELADTVVDLPVPNAITRAAIIDKWRRWE